ncbi:MAG: hypothetical protein DSZ09_01405 [Sulfurovum sp.]|nr:MAG: hypothetical protein DSZ09_01405 [Sulfurovum sp.]
MWVDGESEGSCDNVSALEAFTKESGKKSGHLFGHTHAYSRGYSRDIDHLWLNTASAGGYREKLNNASTRSLTKDYNIFSISSSQFGFTIITINGEKSGDMALKRYRGTITSQADGYASLSSVFDENYDLLNITESYIAAPHTTYGIKTFSSVANAVLDISVDNTSQVNEVQWQLCTSNDFTNSHTVNVWGNITRKKNIWYKNDDTVEGIDVNTQKDANIFRLALNTVDSEHFEQDEQRKWDKAGMTSHVSDYSPYKNGETPVTINFSSGNTYYWRARLRDVHMNWSKWSTVGEFYMQ